MGTPYDPIRFTAYVRPVDNLNEILSRYLKARAPIKGNYGKLVQKVPATDLSTQTSRNQLLTRTTFVPMAAPYPPKRDLPSVIHCAPGDQPFFGHVHLKPREKICTVLYDVSRI